MNVSTKLGLGYGLLLALLAGLLLYHVSTVEANAAEGRKLSAVTSRVLLSATDQRYWLAQMEESVMKFRISGDTGYVRKFEDFAERFGSALDTFRTVELTSEEQERLERLSDTWEQFRQVTSRSVGGAAPAQEGGGGAPTVSRFGGEAEAAEDTAAFAGTLGTSFRRLREQTDSLVGASRAAMQARVEAADRRARRAELAAWFGGGLALLLSAAVWFLVVRSLTRGLRSLTAATRQVAEGDFGHRLEVEGDDEFAQLARAFNVMTEHLAELDELKRNFVSRISHDLKSPLASIQEANNLMLEGMTGELSEEQERFIELSRENGRRLEQMISKLLELSRLEAGVPDAEHGRHELRELVRTTADRMAPSFRKRDVELDLDLPGEPVPVVCDREQIEQLLENLLENARRHTPDGSRVAVRLDLPSDPERALPERGAGGAASDLASGEVVRLSVVDGGAGVEEGEKERIFDRFHHGNGSSGAGLGLALCREIASAHGGVVGVEDAATGGAEFVVLLPRDAAREPADEPEETDPRPEARAVG